MAEVQPVQAVSVSSVMAGARSVQDGLTGCEAMDERSTACESTSNGEVEWSVRTVWMDSAGH